MQQHKNSGSPDKRMDQTLSPLRAQFQNQIKVKN